MEFIEAEQRQLEFWRAATVATAGGVGLGVTLFGALAAVADRRPAGWDPGAPVLVLIVAVVLGAIAGVCVVVRRTPNVLGAATGMATAALVIGLSGLVLQ
ncbi:hypothetical protein [Nocardia asteroides]|uniref:hypothetical protein n=1 Tax=Nocardia asteroides TaxID=1824 RepID=UPI001E295419|nr:hypothetical protein [Nocardia asteroides]UGT58075.1 hypothetical protein LTT85_15110 [Nocardia asteroides]